MHRLTLYSLAVFLVVPFAYGIVIKDNVVFYKTNEISTTRAKWLATLVIDFDDFEHFMSLVTEDIKCAEATLSITLSTYTKQNKEFEAFRNVLEGIRGEVDFLRRLQDSIRNEVIQIMQQMHNSSQEYRVKRSLLPFVGEGLSWLFGVVSDKDIDRIKYQIATLARNQKRVIHVVKEGISVINESRVLIKENRQSIIGIIGSIRQMDSTINDIKNDLERKVSENRLFLEVYTRLGLVLGEIRIMLKDAGFYLMNLKSQLNFLALGKISTTIISPPTLQMLLLQIQDSTPSLISLINNPRTDLWAFYRYLTSSTYFVDGKILIVMSIPLVRLDQSFEVYKAISIPIIAPVDLVHTKRNRNKDLMANYRLEANGFLIDKSRTNYQLLSDQELKSCCHENVKFCTVRSAVYPVALANTCLISLFTATRKDVANVCLTQVTRDILPLAFYLFEMNWIIISRTSLNFAKVCNGRSSDLQTNSPLDVIKVEKQCTVSNKYFALSTPYVVGKSIYREDSFLKLKAANFSKNIIWKPFQDKFINTTEIKIPDQLSDINDMPLNQLIMEMDSTFDVDGSRMEFPRSIWYYISLSLALLVVVVIVVYCLRKRKCINTCLPNCMRRVKQTGQQDTASTEFELHTMDTGRHILPTVIAATAHEALGEGQETLTNTRSKLYPSLFGPNGRFHPPDIDETNRK